MILKGFQPTSTIDYPGNICSVLFTAGCNMKCPYCHNAMLASNSSDLSEIPSDEIFKKLESRKNLIDGVCITGGEPTIHKDLPLLIKKIKDMGLKVKLDSNGTNPEMLRQLIDEKLIDYIAMDIKQTLENYKQGCGVDIDTSKIQKSIDIIKENKIPYEFRTTITPEVISKEDVLDIGELLNGSEQYSIQQFIPAQVMFNKNLTLKYPIEELVALQKELNKKIKKVNLK